MRPLLTELNRRNVTRVAAAYALVGWIFIEAGSVLLPTFGAPEWAFRVWVLVVIAGFVASVIFAWVFEVTPEGIRLEKDVDRSRSIAGRTGRKLNAAIIALMATALTVSVTLNVIGLRKGTGGGRDADYRSIAVLPFDSRSTDPENVYFTDGIHDDLLTTLANISSLKVISRTSVMEYRDTRKNLRDIARELGVGTVLEGAVQRSGDSVRINVQLIDAETDRHLWAETYDRVLNTRNIFAMQSEISSAIASRLEATLTEQEKDRLAVVRTENLEAYDLVLAGRNSLHQRRLETLHQARSQFEQAVALDRGYAEAWVGLANSLMLLFINHQALAEDEALPRARAALDKALALDPDNADVQASLGLLLSTRGSEPEDAELLAAAETAFQRAIELSPNHVQAHMWYASLIDDRGDTRKAIALYERAVDLDPLARVARLNLPRLYLKLGESGKAMDTWLSAIRLHPEWPDPYELIAVHLERSGRLDEALAWATRARQLDTDPLAGGNLVTIYLEMGDMRGAKDVLARFPPDHTLHGIMSAAAALVDDDAAGALRGIEQWMASVTQRREFALNIAQLASLLSGDLEKARDYFLEEYPGLGGDELPRLDVDNINDAVALGYVLVRLGDGARATELLEAVLASARRLPRLGLVGHGVADVRALALLGRSDEAISTLEAAVAEGFVGGAAFSLLRLDEDPLLESLRERPRFVQILSELDSTIAAMRERAEAAAVSGEWDALLSLAGSHRIATTSP